MGGLKIIYDGDSWVFGSEIVNPYFNNGDIGDCNAEKNDSYRIERIFPTHLSKLLNASEFVNLGWVGDDNGTILNRTINYIVCNYLSKGLAVDDLFVVIGWSSLERHYFWYKDKDESDKFRIWPQYLNDKQLKKNAIKKKFWEIYVEYLWNPEEFIPRHIMNVLQLQNFCDNNNIKWLCFNSFYQTPGKGMNELIDLNITEELQRLDLHGTMFQNSESYDRYYQPFEYSKIWDLINDKRYYKKDCSENSFYSFIQKNNKINPLNGQHPSPESHKIWAIELARYIQENNLL